MAKTQSDPPVHTAPKRLSGHPSSSPAAARLPEDVLFGGRYRIRDELGRGGMAVVYRALDVSTDTEVALKNLQAQAGEQVSRRSVSMFEREFHMLSQLAHPRIIDVYDYGVDASGPFYTMELLDGGDLKRLAPLDPIRVCELMLEVCSSLALLHSRRLLHRDISPRNIRCTHDGHAKLIDFGAIMPMGPATEIVGTPAFVAPEVLHHAVLDARSDLFSLGGTLYYALTRKLPFAASDFAELREAWNREFIPPSRRVAGIPPALDALCASLLRIDPAQRPRSAFEVMLRLGTIAGIEERESLDDSRAYLDTPVLVGREAELRGVRYHLRRALHGAGKSMLFHGKPGLGRSRMLDACGLEGKTCGAIVLRAGAAISPDSQFGVAQQLFEQLLQQVPAAALEAAHNADVSEQLFQDAPSEGTALGHRIRLRPFADPPGGRARLQMALCAWLARICDGHAVVIAVDDVDRIDEPSLALLAGLAIDAPHTRLLLVTAADPGAAELATGAYRLLVKHSLTASLSPLTLGETGELIASLFGDVSNVALVADRIYNVALGSPKQTLALAQHLVDTGVIEYQDAQWTLPAKLDATDLPADFMDAFVHRIRALPALARELAESQALLGSNVLSRDDFLKLAPEASATDVEGALLALLESDLLQSDGLFYSLSHRPLANTLRDMMSEEARRARHLTLARFRAQQEHFGLDFLVAHHLSQAGHFKESMEVFAKCAVLLDESQIEMALNLDLTMLATATERALGQTHTIDLPRRVQHELRFALCTLSIVSPDEGVYYRSVAAWLAQLEQDSGLADYRALPGTLEPSARLQQALSLTTKRFQETPERDRVYPLDEALKMLCFYVTASIAVGTRTLDTSLLASLPPLLEPMASLSPALHAIWQNSLSVQDSVCLGRTLSAKTRARAVYEHLGKLAADEVPYLDSLQKAVAHGLACYESRLARDEALIWADLLDADPLYRVNAMGTRAATRVMQGDPEGAEAFRKQAERLALRSSTRQVFDTRWGTDLEAAVLACDLGGVRRALEGITPLAARHRGWVATRCNATGYFELFKGSVERAEVAFNEALELCAPQRPVRPPEDTWVMAVAGMVSVRTVQERFEEAIVLAQTALTRCEAQEIDIGRLVVARALATAEARAGLIEQAAKRVENAIEWSLARDIGGLHLVASYEVRARIAVWAHDGEAANHYALLAMRERGPDTDTAAAPEVVRLVDEARASGLEITLGLSQFEASVLGTTTGPITLPPVARAFADKLAACPDAAARANQALLWLCEITQASGGHLYLVGAGGELSLAASHEQAPPGARDVAFVRAFFAEHIDENGEPGQLDEMTQATHMLTLPGAATYIDERGTEQRVLVLSCKVHGELAFVGLAATTASGGDVLGAQAVLQCSAVASALIDAGEAPHLPSAEDVTRMGGGARHG